MNYPFIYLEGHLQHIIRHVKLGEIKKKATDHASKLRDFKPHVEVMFKFRQLEENY